MTTPAQDTRDRVIRMEERMKGLEDKIEDQGRKIDEMYELLTKARGAKLALILIAALVGGIVAKVGPLLSYIFPNR